jgi:putative DNA primase/helicase
MTTKPEPDIAELDRQFEEERRAAGNGKDDGGLPEIRVEPGKLPELAVQGEQALMAARARIYRRDTILVRPAIDEVEAAHGRRTYVARLVEVDAPYLRGELSKVARWERFNIRKDAWTPTNPPHEVAQLILARYGDWELPAVSGVITTPTLRPDGTILSAAGYDPATRLYLMSPPRLVIPAQPSKADALEALKFLDGALEEFPFVDEPSRSVARSAIISTVVRGAFPVLPMHTSRSPMPATGKSYLWDTVAIISTGQLCPVMTAGPSAEETEKRLGSALMAGQALISIDNVSCDLGGDALCQAIERPVVQIRILGRSELFRIEARGTTIFATGNNLTLTGDVVRRCLLCSLDANLERPEQRQFNNNPVETILANRPKYIAAALRIVRAYFVAGRPDRAPRLASFEGWSDTVRSSLVWLGCADPVETMEKAREEDPKLILLRQMLSTWSEAIGTGETNARTVAEVVKLIEDIDGISQFPALKAAVTEVGSARGRFTSRNVGDWLRRHRGKIANRLRFARDTDKHGAKWWVETV